MEDYASQKPGGTFGSHKCVLSIDGGGVRGLIPAQSLEYLEECLQENDGPDARIADYFDVIAGTSTGGLIAIMLTAPDEHKRPMFTAKGITQFYVQNSKKIFPKHWLDNVPILGAFAVLIRSMLGPKYSSDSLEHLLQAQLKDTMLSQTVKRILIPAFDTKIHQPVFFTTQEAKSNANKDAPLWRVGRGTSAAPTYFPAVFFSSTQDIEYHLTDGGLCANNPTFLAMIESFKEPDSNKLIKSKRSLLERFDDCMVLSLGCGTQAHSYDAREVSKWGALGWVNQKGGAPIVNMLMDAGSEMMDNNISLMFKIGFCRQNLVRIQTSSLDSHTGSVDDSSPKNLLALVNIGKNLLEEPVTRINYATGENKLVDGGQTNKAAIARFAKWLCMERKARLSATPE